MKNTADDVDLGPSPRLAVLTTVPPATLPQDLSVIAMSPGRARHQNLAGSRAREALQSGETCSILRLGEVGAIAPISRGDMVSSLIGSTECLRRPYRRTAGAIACVLSIAGCVAMAAGSAAGVTGSRSRSTTTTASPSAQRYTTANTPIGTLAADPAAKAIVAKYIPGLLDPQVLPQVSHTTLKGIQGYAYSVLTDEVLAEIDAEFAKLTPLTPEQGGGPLVGDVNYDEASVKPYTLPDPLVLSNGKRVTDSKTWWATRRPQILKSYTDLVYGRVPNRPAGEHFEVTESAAPAFGGAARRTQVTIHLGDAADAPVVHLIEYVPAGATKPVPTVLVLGFQSTTAMFDDPDFPVNGGPAAAPPELLPKFPTTDFLNAGFGVAGIYGYELDSDSPDSYDTGVRAYFNKVAQASQPSNSWGAIAAWGWGLSRAQDYLETDPAVDAKRVSVYGASRFGRAVLWAGARDQRFAAVIACCSGKFGGAVLRRNYGDALNTLPGYWFAPALKNYLGDINKLPVDAPMLLALVAPRPVLLQTGHYDHAGDPKGEFLSAVDAGPVYKLLGAKDLGASAKDWPPKQPILRDIGYFMHEGGHGTASTDWPIYLAFLKQHLDKS